MDSESTSDQRFEKFGFNDKKSDNRKCDWAHQDSEKPKKLAEAILNKILKE